MATSKDTSSWGHGPMRNASEPFTIYLDDSPYILDEDTLKKQVSASLTKKRDWFYPILKFVSFKHGTLKFLNTYDDVSYEMTVLIEPYKLHVSCSCKMPVQTLCLHTYKALGWLILYRNTDYFEKYRPKGIIELADRHKKYFDKKILNTGVNIIPKANLNSVYRLADKLKGLNLTEVLNLPSITSSRNNIKETELTYILMDSFRHKNLTFLLPCFGTLNKVGTDIKAFQHFITTTRNEYNQFLTGDQVALNKICMEMWHEAETQSGSIIKAEPGKEHAPALIFNLWEKAMPLLLHQEFIYRYYLFSNKELKERPQKNRIERINLLKVMPHLHFLLIEKEAFYQLKMKVSISDRDINNYDSDATFFIADDKKMYLLSSLKDAGLVEWMWRSGDHITIFKEHFKEFEQEYLVPLGKNYKITIIRANG